MSTLASSTRRDIPSTGRVPFGWGTLGLDRLPVSKETRRRWQRRRSLPSVPALAVQLLEGDLGLISTAWIGWKLDHRTGALITPEGVTWTSTKLKAWEYEQQLLEEYRQRLARPEQWRLL